MTEFKSFVKRTIYVVLPVILFTVYCIPIQADVIPIKDLERAELILYGTISDSAILQSRYTGDCPLVRKQRNPL